MKPFFIQLFQPILNLFEKGEQPLAPRPSHRTFLMVLGVLFLILSGVSLYFSMRIGEMMGLLPTITFAAVGIVSLIVALLGTDRAVANIWRNR